MSELNQQYCRHRSHIFRCKSENALNTPQRVFEPMYQAFTSYLAFISMIQTLLTPYLIYAEIVLKFTFNSCFIAVAASRLKFAFIIFRKPYNLNKYVGPSSNLPLADCIGFPYTFKTLGSGNSYDSRTQPKMSAHGDETQEKRKR